MKRNPAMPTWSRALALATCVGLSGGAFASTGESSPVNEKPYEERTPYEPVPDEPVPYEPVPYEPPKDTLTVPESVVRVMELYESFPKDTITGTAKVQEYLKSLPSDQYEAYVSYFEKEAQRTLQAAEERYAREAEVDPEAAWRTYEETLKQTQGYDGSEPQSVPTKFEPVPYDDQDAKVSRSVAAFSGEGSEKVIDGPTRTDEPACLAKLSADGSTYEDLCGGGDLGGVSPGTGTGMTPLSCSSYTDRFGNSWSRCDTSQVAYVYIHGAGSYSSYHSASNGYWGYNNLAGTVGSNRFFVSWDATQSVQSQTGVVRQALDTLCAPKRPCVLITHSAGGLMMGRILSQENRWNILRIHSVQSAAGGSELANATLISPILWIVNSLGLLQNLGGHPIYSLSLPVPIARGMYNHDVTNGVPFITYSSERERGYRSCRWYQLGCHADNAWSSLVNNTMRNLYGGGSDWLVAYHSTAAFRADNWNTANTTCNPDSWTSPGGWGTPYYGASDRQAHYWANHTPYHWQPAGHNFTCRRGYTYVDHAGGQMIRTMPMAW